MTVEFRDMDIFGNASANSTVVEPGTSFTLCAQTLLSPRVELIVYPNPTGDKTKDTIQILELRAGEVERMTDPLVGNQINTSRETHSRTRGYQIRSV